MKAILKNSYFVALSCIGLTFLCYFSAIEVGYLSDDYGFVLQAEKWGWKAFNHNFNDPFFIPVSHFIALVFYQLVDGNSVAFHILQLVIHGLIAWQFYLLVRQLNTPNTLALLAAVLFIVLPYQSESVVWLSAKSYGYSLLFSLISMRYFFTWLVSKRAFDLTLHFLMLSLAILAKEMAYSVPFLLGILVVMIFKKSSIVTYTKSQLITYLTSIFLLFTLLLLLRWFVLDSIIGGYGEMVHIPSFSVIGLHFFAWLFKFATLYRYALESSIFMVFATMMVLSIVTGLFLGWKKKRIPFIQIIGFILLLFFALAPVLSLEITSVKSIASERYGYFSSLIVAFIMSYSLFQFSSKLRLGVILFVAVISITFIQFDLYKWRQSSSICHQYLIQLTEQDINNKRVLLINVPDNYRGAYCLRNGIKEYVALQNLNTNIKVAIYQTYMNHTGGITKIDEILTEQDGAIHYYAQFPHKRFNISLWNDTLMTDFDRVLIYHNNKFELLK